MTARDVLISRVPEALEFRRSRVPGDAPPDAEPLWAVTAEGQQSLTLRPFKEALDVALTWAGESGGEIYRLDQPGAEPGLYKGAW